MKHTLLLAILLFTTVACVTQEHHHHDFGILHYSADGGTEEFRFDVGENWEIISQPSDWIKISPTRGLKGEYLKIQVEKNTLFVDRTEIIGIKFSDEESGEINILQDANKE